jgi:hypothetical protein
LMYWRVPFKVCLEHFRNDYRRRHRGGSVERKVIGLQDDRLATCVIQKDLSDVVQSSSPVRTPRSHMTAVRRLHVVVLTFLSHPARTGGRLLSTVGWLARIVRLAIAQCWRYSRPRKC